MLELVFRIQHLKTKLDSLSLFITIFLKSFQVKQASENLTFTAFLRANNRDLAFEHFGKLRFRIPNAFCVLVMHVSSLLPLVSHLIYPLNVLSDW